MSIEPNWQPMNTMPDGVRLAWLYSHNGVSLGNRVGSYWYDRTEMIGAKIILGPVRWTPFLKPEGPKDIRL